VDSNLYKEVCFKYNNKIYFGKIINSIGGLKYKEYKMVSLTEDGQILCCWIKADQIIKDRRSLHDRRKDLDK